MPSNALLDGLVSDPWASYAPGPRRTRNVLIASAKSPFLDGGAEVLARELLCALRAGGVRADLIEIPFYPRPIERVVSAIHLTRLMDVAETNFGPVDLVIGMKFPAYLMPHPSRVLWLLHQYRQMYDLWDEPGIGFGHVAGADALREAVRTVDKLAIQE